MSKRRTRSVSFPWPVDYKPKVPRNKKVGIGIIGTGGIVQSTHLRAYAKMGLKVTAICDINKKTAKKVSESLGGVPWYTDRRYLLDRKDIDVIDAATHPKPRVNIIKDALEAGKDVLSQKPFVLDLNVGRDLVKLAKRKKRILAVNQNGRYSPNWKAAGGLIEAGAVGTIQSVRHHCRWDHNWVVGLSFDKLRHLILYDFAIHWFDVTTSWLKDAKAKMVHGCNIKAPGQRAKGPMLAHATVQYDRVLASLIFDANCPANWPHEFFIEGTEGAIISRDENEIEVHKPDGVFKTRLEGNWFPDGFCGTMGEFLCAREQGRQPWINAKDNLKSLQVCFAACIAADKNKLIDPNKVTKLPPGNVTA